MEELHWVNVGALLEERLHHLRSFGKGRAQVMHRFGLDEVVFFVSQVVGPRQLRNEEEFSTANLARLDQLRVRLI